MASLPRSRLACVIACGLLATGCGGAPRPGSTGPPRPPTSQPTAAYPAAVAAPLETWRAALDAAAAALRSAAVRPAGAGRASAADAVAGLRAAGRHATATVAAAGVPLPLRGANRALLRAIGLTGRGAVAMEGRIRRWPFGAKDRVPALARAAHGVHRWARMLATRGTPAPGWATQLAASSASLAHAARAAFAAPALGPGTAGAGVGSLQRRLGAIGYLPLGYVTDSYDGRTMQAVVAFQGWDGQPRDGIAGPVTLARLAIANRPHPWSTAGRHLEIHTAQQVLLLVEGGAAVRAIHVSTAAPGHVTPAGTFTIYRKELMSWSVPFQVWMPYASYFTGGYAIHEYPDVPPYPASHGCVRVPAEEAPTVWDFAAIGTPVVIS